VPLLGRLAPSCSTRKSSASPGVEEERERDRYSDCYAVLEEFSVLSSRVHVGSPRHARNHSRATRMWLPIIARRVCKADYRIVSAPHPARLGAQSGRWIPLSKEMSNSLEWSVCLEVAWPCRLVLSGGENRGSRHHRQATNRWRTAWTIT